MKYRELYQEAQARVSDELKEAAIERLKRLHLDIVMGRGDRVAAERTLKKLLDSDVPGL